MSFTEPKRFFISSFPFLLRTFIVMPKRVTFSTYKHHKFIFRTIQIYKKNLTYTNRTHLWFYRVYKSISYLESV